MDLLAHGIWAGIGVAWGRRRCAIPRRTALATVALAVVPDLLQGLPLLALVLQGTLDASALLRYATASPGQEPALSPLVALWTHHLHCIGHSAVIAAAVTLLAWWWLRRLWLPLLGWWSHVVIDVFTHSAAFYPSPVFYPFTYWGFDGLAWNTPWFLALNYAAIVAALVWLRVHRRESSAP